MEKKNHKYRIIVILPSTLLWVQTFGCRPCGSPAIVVGRALRGRVVDSSTFVGLTGASVTGVTLTEGIVTASGPTIRHAPTPDEEGSFEVSFFFQRRGRCGFLGIIPPVGVDFPDPDQVELRVVRDACEKRVLIDLNQDTVVDITFPDDIIELKDPILVPPCGP